MELPEFRTAMIDKVRAFDKWAFSDYVLNPQDWSEANTFEDYFDMFKEFIRD